IRRAFRWGVENELVKADSLERLRAVAALAKGRTAAPEQKKVRAVPFETIEKTVAKLTPLYAALVRFHLYGGMRAEEAVTLRPCDLDRGSTPWLYRPWIYKTYHLDQQREREVWLGPKARAAIESLLKGMPAKAYVFPGRGRGPHA